MSRASEPTAATPRPRRRKAEYQRRAAERVRLFVRALLAGPLGTRGVGWKSAEAAGYKGGMKSLAVRSSTLLADSKVQAELSRWHAKEDLTVERWLLEVKRLAYSNVEDLATWDHDGGLVLKPSAELDRDALASIREVTDETITRHITEEEFVVAPGTPPLKRGRQLRIVKPGEPALPAPTPETRLRRREEVVHRLIKARQHDKIEALKLLGRFHELLKDHPTIIINQMNVIAPGLRSLGDEELRQLAILEAKALGTALPAVFDLPAEDVTVEPVEASAPTAAPRYSANGDER